MRKQVRMEREQNLTLKESKNGKFQNQINREM